MRIARPFPLTPTLSLRERVCHIQSFEKSKRLTKGNRRAMILPLPRGEGRGEGERD